MRLLALLLGLVALRLAPAFLPAAPAPHTLPTVSARAKRAELPRQTSAKDNIAFAAAAVGVAAAVLKNSPKRHSVHASSLTGSTLCRPSPESGSVARRSLYSCYTLYFRRWRYYEDRARRNLRNRAYNIFMKNRYKKAMKKVLRYVVELEYGDKEPASHQEVMDEVKDMLDEACETIDEVTVQGVLHRNTAAKRKDRLFRGILRACVKKDLLPERSDEDRFTPAYKLIGYTLPECNFVREPRPWQLPGWKSPWMLKWEWEKWRKLTGRK
mmetsp:Transcript_12808/g.30436  ORF Transcript_12808/g.30436 Transcript_12808/m.30436 type:complete len:269 (-) Transcript_12808:35-841(-)